MTSRSTSVGIGGLGFAIAGPVGYAITTKSDRQTRDSLNYVSNTLNSYVSVNNQLLDTLEAGLNDSEARMYGGNDNLRTTALRLESEGTIKYTPNTQAPVTKDDDNNVLLRTLRQLYTRSTQRFGL